MCWPRSVRQHPRVGKCILGADVQRRIREAIGLHLEAMRGRGEDVPETSAVVEVIEV